MSPEWLLARSLLTRSLIYRLTLQPTRPSHHAHDAATGFAAAAVADPALHRPNSASDMHEATYSAACGNVSAPCEGILGDFKICSDECYTHFKKRAAVAPECTLSGTGNSIRVGNEGTVKLCESARTCTTNKYTPNRQPGLTKCAQADIDTWVSKYGFRTFMGNCSEAVELGGLCSDACLKAIEDGVEAAKVCQLTGDYSFREMQKIDLVACIQSRVDKLANNTVLQRLANDSIQSNSDAEAITAPPTTIKSSASALATSLAIGVGSIVTLTLTVA